jgi:hypothetical protein
MVIQKLLAISGSCLVCFVLGFGCAGTDATSEDTSGNGEPAPANIGTSEQDIILPLPGPGTGGSGSQQCVSACTKLSATNIAGTCCICNGQMKKLVRSPANANMYLCQ